MPNRLEFRVDPERRHEAQALAQLQARALRSFAPPPPGIAGRGIVTSVSDRGIAAAWVLLGELVRLGVALPVEAWHRPGELSAANRAHLDALPLDLTVREMADDVSGFAIKPVALWRSRFREVLWLDFDSYPLRDPTFLFEDPEYAAKGSLFWRDTCGTDRAVTWHPGAPVWPVFGVPYNSAEEFETGQVRIDKGRCWTELSLTAYYAFNHRFFYHFVLGDKDTFRLAWQRVALERGQPPHGPWYHSEPARVPYGFMPYGPVHTGRPNAWGAWGGGTVLLQRDRAGQPLFCHRNTEKFTLDGANPFYGNVPNEAFHHAHVAELARLSGVPDRLSSVPAAPAWGASPYLPAAWGDVLDRLTILRIKRARIADPARLANVVRELAAVEAVVGSLDRFPPDLPAHVEELTAVNGALWEIEDAVRECEREGRFDDAFVELARSVYRENDRRAAVKQRISRLLGSALVEEKSYAPTA
jgi:hypothetical protein